MISLSAGEVTTAADAQTGAQEVTEKKTRPKPKIAFVSLLLPGGRRTRYWYLATCPVCRSPHLGRDAQLADVTRTRKLPCGHTVEIAIARTYGRPGPA
jgi:hypothetical protein